MDHPLYTLPKRTERPVLDTSSHTVKCGVDDVLHITDFISAEEEAEMVRCVNGAPEVAWTKLRGRRLQSLGGLPRPPPEMMTREPLPQWVQTVCAELVRCGAFPAEFPPNHVLLNEYQPGQGIDAHKDGPLYAPHVAILSLGSHATFQFTDDSVARRTLASLLIPPRGLLVFRGTAYEDCLHTVAADASDDLGRSGLVRLDHGCPVAAAGAMTAPRSRRLSLTVRHVLHSRAQGEPDAAVGAGCEATPVPLWTMRRDLCRLLDKRSPRASPQGSPQGSPKGSPHAQFPRAPGPESNSVAVHASSSSRKSQRPASASRLSLPASMEDVEDHPMDKGFGNDSFLAAARERRRDAGFT